MANDLAWNEVLRMFRMLGGTAQNVRQKYPGSSRGLLTCNPEEPVHVQVPPNLLFRVEDVEFDDDRLRLKETADAGEAERFFFEDYQKRLSWEPGGRPESLAFIHAFDALPEQVRLLLAEEFGFGDLMAGDAIERARKRFLKARTIRFDQIDFIAPIIELANPGASGLSGFADQGLNIHGVVGDEVFVSYGIHDSMSLFRNFGLINREPGAFSQPTELQLQNRKVTIFEDVSSARPWGNMWGPYLDTEGNNTTLSFLMIGHRTMPKQPRGLFRALAAEAKIDRADEIFDTILQFNWDSFLKLLAVLEPHEGEMIVKLRTVARYQLEAISHCIGAIDPGMPARPSEEPLKEEPPKEDLWNFSIE